MVAYIGQRLLSLLFMLFLATIAIFAMMHAVPGGPFTFTQGDMSPAGHAQHHGQVRPGRARSGSSTSTGSGSCCTAIWVSPSRSRP